MQDCENNHTILASAEEDAIGEALHQRSPHARRDLGELMRLVSDPQKKTVETVDESECQRSSLG